MVTAAIDALATLIAGSKQYLFADHAWAKEPGTRIGLTARSSTRADMVYFFGLKSQRYGEAEPSQSHPATGQFG